MSGYRDELEAAQARIAQLEEKLDDKKREDTGAVEAARRRGEARERARQALTHKASDEQLRRTIARGKRAPSRVGTETLGMVWILVGVAAFFGVISTIAALLHPVITSWGLAHANPQIVIAQAEWVIVIVLGAFMLVVRASVRRATAREMAWVEALPFAVVGHFRLLGDGSCKCHLDFEGEPAKRDVVYALASGIRDAHTTVRIEKESPLELDVRIEDVLTIHGHWVGWRSFVNDVLLPMHDAAPIVSVTFET